MDWTISKGSPKLNKTLCHKSIIKDNQKNLNRSKFIIGLANLNYN